MVPVSNDYALVASTEDSLIICNTHIVWYTASDKHISFYLDLHDKIQRQQKELIIGSIMYNIHILHIFQTVIRNASAVKASSLSLQAIFLTGSPCSFWRGKKRENRKRFASFLPSVTEWLDSQGCWQQFESEIAPPCRLCAGSPVCCGSSASSRTQQHQRDFTHYSTATWLPSLYHMHLTSFKFCLRLWRFYLQGLQNTFF